MTKYEIYFGERRQQDLNSKSFCGGKPRLPKRINLPTCSLCDSAEIFYFQLAFPDDHPWKGLTLAMFACTSCAFEDYLIPEMLTTKLKDAMIPHDFLKKYQRNFHVLVAPTNECESLIDYDEKIIFREILLRPFSSNSAGFGIIGSDPHWILEDESPLSYEGNEMVFLFQIHFENQFEITPDSPKQIELSLEGSPESSPFDYYQLFIGNEIYFYGSAKPGSSVYIWTQVE